MTVIKEFNDYLKEIVQEIEGINCHRMVTSEKQMAKYINDLRPEENAMVLGLVPNFGNNGSTNADSLRLKAFTEIMILEKTDFSYLDDDEFVDQSDRLFALAEKVYQKLLDDHTSQVCNFLRMLDPNSLQIVDVYDNSQCNGWTIVFTFDKL